MAADTWRAEAGRFILGCNYWASHAGTAMWTDWQPEVVDRDLARLAEAGLDTLRVFPLWPAFQPITLLRGHAGRPVEFAHGERTLEATEAGRAGVSAEAVGRFAEFLDLAEKHRFRLIVPLITGWMSGRWFVPPALEGRNVLTDPVAIQWQVRFVRYFVRRFREAACIAAWELGNECNCLGEFTREAFWVWASAITDAIRAADPSRPVVAGLHGLRPDPEAGVTIQDIAEVTDVLTTHPYPLFTPHCGREVLTAMRPALHAAAETRLYADVGSKPCLAEELGTLGPMFGCDASAANYLRMSLFSLWAHDGGGLLWWCAFDQDPLEHPPYAWTALERELGLIRSDGRAKPVLEELSRFRRFLDRLPFSALPPRLADGVCVLTQGQDCWGVAQSSFLLAKQAGLDIEFQYEDQPLREAGLYLVPSVCGTRAMSRRMWQALLGRVRDGATLYISCGNGILSEFEATTGLRVLGRSDRPLPAEVVISDGEGGRTTLELAGPVRLALEADHAEVLAREADGNPVFARTELGRGSVLFFALPLEQTLARAAGAFAAPGLGPYWWIYEALARQLPAGRRVVSKGDPWVGLTEHPLPDGRRVVVMVNYAGEDRNVEIALPAGWRLAESLYGSLSVYGEEAGSVVLAAHDAGVFLVGR